MNITKKDEVILRMENIVKDFPGVRALDGANLTVYKGKVTALMGENGAGKSTIMKIFFGIVPRTSGSIFYEGKNVDFTSPREAFEHGIAMVHQELNQVLETSVMDNIFLGRFPKSGIFINKHKMYQETKRIFDELKIDVDPKAIIGSLPVAKRQMVEIAKAVSFDCKVLILDEPTSSLTEVEVKHLFRIVEALKKKGVGILFVSHKMDEVFAIADYVTVFRDGKYISENPISQTDNNTIIKEMVGRELNNLYPAKQKVDKDAGLLLEVENLSSPFCKVKDVSFSVKKGEIFGIAGLVGSQRTEVLDLLFGIRTKSGDSKLKFNNQIIYNDSPKDSMKNNFAYVTEERKQDGIFEDLDITFNMTIARISEYSSAIGLLNKHSMKKDTDVMIDAMSIKAGSHKTSIGSLSGGNQQKVIVGKWMLRQPEIFLMDEPTRGIDVGAKYQIYELMQKLAGYGKSVIMVSSEMGELLGTCHRIAVMSNGRLAGIVETDKTSQEEMMSLAAKHY